MDDTTKKILEIVTDIQAEVSEIKNELTAFRNETTQNFHELRAEIADIRRDVEDLQEKIGNMSGYAKEIDSLMARMAAVEKHVGLAK